MFLPAVLAMAHFASMHLPKIDWFFSNPMELFYSIVNQNLISCKDNSNLLGCVADAVTGNYLLSNMDLSKAEASQLLYESQFI